MKLLLRFLLKKLWGPVTTRGWVRVLTIVHTSCVTLYVVSWSLMCAHSVVVTVCICNLVPKSQYGEVMSEVFMSKAYIVVDLPTKIGIPKWRHDCFLISSLRIACISCPTLFTKLLEIRPPNVELVLLEYDRRFEVYGELFCYYDYNHPLNLPEKLTKNSYGLVVADPPFLSEECLRKTAETIKYLTNDKIFLCTGDPTHLDITFVL